MIYDKTDEILPDSWYFEHLEGEAQCFGGECGNIPTQYLVKACGHSFWSCERHLTSFWGFTATRPELNTCNRCVSFRGGAIPGGAANAYRVVDW